MTYNRIWNSNSLHIRSIWVQPLFQRGSCCSISNFLCSVFCRSLFLFFFHLLLAIVLFVLLRCTVSSWRSVLDTALCDKVCQWLATGRWFSPGTPVSSTNNTDHHDITVILFNTINLPHCVVCPPSIHGFWLPPSLVFSNISYNLSIQVELERRKYSLYIFPTPQPASKISLLHVYH